MKRIFFIILILLIIGTALRGILYRHIITYKSIGQRTNYAVTNNKLIQYIEKNRAEDDSSNIEKIIKTSLSMTSKTLNFTFSKNEDNPNKLIDSKTANCIGYAAFFSTVCNYQLKKNHLAEQWTALPEVGQLYVFGANIHKYFSSPFFRDHDFVIIKNKKTKEIFAVDPSINDYLYIDFVTFKDNKK